MTADWRGVRIESLITPDGAAEVSLVERSVQAPGPDEVIVRVEAAPVNPSDIARMFAFGDVDRAEAGGTAGRPSLAVPLSAGAMDAMLGRVGQPITPGNEGAGTVVAAGSGTAAQALLGRLVSVMGGGLYSQYLLAPVASCVPLPEGASAIEGAGSYVNPMTALGMVETMRAEGHSALVHTAAGSALGRILARVCAADGIALVNVVRSPDQVALLRDAGAEYVCDSSQEGFEEELTAALKATGATLAFDAVGGGRLADRILTCIERASTEGAEYEVYGSHVHKQVYLYGSLDRSPTELRRSYGTSWGVGGWVLPRFLQAAGPERVAQMRGRVAAELTTTFATTFTDVVTLAEALRPEALAAYARPKTGTKFLLTPNG